jgi:hypothetical protein
MKPIAIAAMVLAAAGCTVDEIQATDALDVQTVAPSRVSGPFVQAGTTFRVKLDGPLGTQLSKPGDSFSATLIDPLVDLEGHVLVPAGAKLRGKIANVDQGVAPRLRLSFNTIETEGGAACSCHVGPQPHALPVEARVVRTRSVEYPGQPLYSSYPGDPSIDRNAAVRVDPTVYSYAPGTSGPYSRELELPMGSEMVLELTRPLLGPTSTISKP